MNQMIQSKLYTRDKARLSRDSKGEVRMVMVREMKTMTTIKIRKTIAKSSLVICDIF
jgi:hypothetical protein